MTELLELLSDLKIEYKPDYALSQVSSFRIGGPADVAIFPKNELELSQLIAELKKRAVRFDVIGRASNILFADEGYRGVLIFTKNMNQMSCRGTKISAECGVSLSALSVFARDNSLSGLEFSFGIPGSVGGSVAMNAGAFGREMKNVVVSSRALNTDTAEIVSIVGEKNKFDYRQSIYTENKNLICLSAEFELKECDVSYISATMHKNSAVRCEKQPLDFPNCGSFFKRPEGFFTGKLIEDCGLKGYSVGGAQVSRKHAGFIVNAGGATARDVIELGEIVQRDVLEKFGVKLEREVKYIF